METDIYKTKVKFLVNYHDPKDPDFFAYFPDEVFDNKGNKTCYSHIGQHSGCCLKYAEASRKSTPEEYQDLKLELESLGYNLEIV